MKGFFGLFLDFVIVASMASLAVYSFLFYIPFSKRFDYLLISVLVLLMGVKGGSSHLIILGRFCF